MRSHGNVTLGKALVFFCIIFSIQTNAQTPTPYEPFQLEDENPLNDKANPPEDVAAKIQMGPVDIMGTWIIADFTCEKHLTDDEEIQLPRNLEMIDKYGIDRLVVRVNKKGFLEYRQIGRRGTGCGPDQTGRNYPNDGLGRMLFCDHSGFYSVGSAHYDSTTDQYSFMEFTSKSSTSGIGAKIGTNLNYAKAVSRHDIIVLEFDSYACKDQLEKRYLVPIIMM